LNIVEKCRELCHENDVTLLYLVKFGSHLYGTDTPESDEDYKGIFLPSKKSCFLQNCPKSINLNTGDDKSKNSSKDVDLQLWSLQYFLQLLGKGEVNALDLAYSFTNTKMIVDQSEGRPRQAIIFRRKFFPNVRKFFNIADCNAFVGYAIGQAKKYGIKGSRLGKIKMVLMYVDGYLSGHNASNPIPTLGSIIHNIDKHYHDSSYCFIKEHNGLKFLVLCGRMHQETITLEEFQHRLKIHVEQYGQRAELARQNKGLDFKALSHAVRCLDQMKELIETGRIAFPLKTAEKLKQIKAGQFSFNEIETMINTDIEFVKEKLATGKIEKTRDQKFIDDFIVTLYDFTITKD
jgi:hypothetical protein